jgi:hypothetical protein
MRQVTAGKQVPVTTAAPADVGAENGMKGVVQQWAAPFFKNIGGSRRIHLPRLDLGQIGSQRLPLNR